MWRIKPCDILVLDPHRTIGVTSFDAHSGRHSARRGNRLQPRLRAARQLLCLAAVAVVATSCASDGPVQSETSTASATASSSIPRANPPTTSTLQRDSNTEQATGAELQDDVEPDDDGTSPPRTVAVPPASTSAATTSSSACERVTNFDNGDGWVVVNDGVMGGGSVGMTEFTDSTLQFTGEVVTAGGGFTSVRLQLFDAELADSDSIALRVRADERTYGLTLEDAAQTGRRAVSHRADLTIDGPADGDGWQIVDVSYDDLRPSIFGQPLDAPPFDPDQATEIGIIISDGIDGDFALEVDWIDSCIDRE